MRAVLFVCLHGSAKSLIAVERWDDVPAASEDFNAARDAIMVRLARLLDQSESTPKSDAI